jgi:hypothetical protein
MKINESWINEKIKTLKIKNWKLKTENWKLKTRIKLKIKN